MGQGQKSKLTISKNLVDICTSSIKPYYRVSTKNKKTLSLDEYLSHVDLFLDNIRGELRALFDGTLSKGYSDEVTDDIIDQMYGQDDDLVMDAVNIELDNNRLNLTDEIRCSTLVLSIEHNDYYGATNISAVASYEESDEEYAARLASYEEKKNQRKANKEQKALDAKMQQYLKLKEELKL